MSASLRVTCCKGSVCLDGKYVTVELSVASLKEAKGTMPILVSNFFIASPSDSFIDIGTSVASHKYLQRFICSDAAQWSHLPCWFYNVIYGTGH